MIQVSPSERFSRSYRKLVKKDPARRTKIRECLELFEKEPNHPSLRNHKLVGSLEGHFAISVEYDLRLIYKYIEKDIALLIDIGNHDDVY